MSKSIIKRLLFSVNIHDCRVDTFTVGGHGGSGKDTSNTGVRVTHPPSGAVGRAVDSRKQSENKRLAFRRMGKSKEFQAWARLTANKQKSSRTIEQEVDEEMLPENLAVEVHTEDGWKPYK